MLIRFAGAPPSIRLSRALLACATLAVVSAVAPAAPLGSGKMVFMAQDPDAGQSGAEFSANTLTLMRLARALAAHPDFDPDSLNVRRNTAILNDIDPETKTLERTTAITIVRLAQALAADSGFEAASDSEPLSLPTAARAYESPESANSGPVSRAIERRSGVTSQMLSTGDVGEVRLLLTMELQNGGSRLASAPYTDCRYYSPLTLSPYYWHNRGACQPANATLSAGDGVGFNIGLSIPLSEDFDMEMTAGYLGDYLEDSQVKYSDPDAFNPGYQNSISRYALRAQLLKRTHNGKDMRWGFGLVAHLSGKYKRVDLGRSQKIDAAPGVRFQMDWGTDGDDSNIRYGYYVQGMRYTIEGIETSQRADALGLTTSFLF